MNMMTTDAWAENNESAISKLVAAWERKLTQNGAKAAGLGLMAVSLAACGDSDTTTTTTGGGGGGTVPPVVTVDGTAEDGNAVDGGGTATVELKGNTDPNVDAGEWINVANLLVRDANGDFTITDIQATENDAAAGSAGMDIALEDIGQTHGYFLDAGPVFDTVTLNFDTQAIDDSDTVVNLSLNEVAGIVALTGNSAIETVNITIADGENEATLLTDLQINGVTTINVTGGVVGQYFGSALALDSTLSVLDASGAVGDLVFDVTGTGSGTFTMGSGDDWLRVTDSLDSGDMISGGAGLDQLDVRFETAGIRQPTMTDVENLNVVFFAPATFDGTNVTGLTTINLGLQDLELGIGGSSGTLSSSADADVNNMDASLTTLNVMDSSFGDIEVDYASGVDANLDINIGNGFNAIQIGDNAGSDDIQLIGVKNLSINATSGFATTINNSIDLNGDTETLIITTSQDGGDLSIDDNNNAAFTGTEALTDITISAVNGDMDLSYNNGTFNLINEAENLQTYTVTAEDADVEIGLVSFGEGAIELEKVIINMVDNASLNHGEIDAYDNSNNVGANISLFEVTTSDKNTAFAGHNVFLNGFSAAQVDNMVLNAVDGGIMELRQLSFEVSTQTYTGNGDIELYGPTNPSGLGFIQNQAADASAHTGARYYELSQNSDVVYGSSGADEIVFRIGSFSASSRDAYFDAGGNDDITFTNNGTVTSIFDDGTASLTDTGTATDDTYTFTLNTTATMTVGGGNDTLNLNSTRVTVDFADYDSGTVAMTGFTTGTDELSFDGMGDITAVTGTAFVVGATEQTLNVNDVYVFADGDAVPVTGGSNTIADYTNMTDVAAFLNEAFADAINNGDEAVFVINNGTAIVPNNTPGTAHDAYVYYYLETGGAAGIQIDELTLIATADGSTIVAGDVV